MCISFLLAQRVEVIVINPEGPSSPYFPFLVPKKALKSYHRGYLDPLGKRNTSLES